MNYIRSFLASKAAADRAAVDAVGTTLDAAMPVNVAVTAVAAGIDGCNTVPNSCAFNCCLKVFGFDGDGLRE